MHRTLVTLALLSASPALAQLSAIETCCTPPPARPDLVLLPVGADPQVAPEGQPAVVSFDLLNRGTAISPAAGVRLMEDGKRARRALCPELAPGATCRVSWAFDLGSGQYPVEACADSDGQVAESDETNNCRTVQLHVLPAPADVVFDSFVFDPPNPLAGEAVTATVRLRNAGPAVGYPVALTRGGAAVGQGFCPVVLGDDQCVVSVSFTAPAAGDHRFEATARGESVSAWLVVEPTGGPNLTLTPDDVTRSVAAPVNGDLVTFTAWIRNAGDAATDRGFHGRLYYDGAVAEEVWCPAGLQPGDRCGPFSFNAIARPGQHIFEAEGDVYDVIAEPAEFDNRREMPFAVSEQPVMCEGTWTLIGDNGHVASAPGYVINGCDVYWGANAPTGCMTTIGDQGMTVAWSSISPVGCPRRAVVTLPGGGTIGYSVQIH